MSPGYTGVCIQKGLSTMDAETNLFDSEIVCEGFCGSCAEAKTGCPFADENESTDSRTKE